MLVYKLLFYNNSVLKMNTPDQAKKLADEALRISFDAQKAVKDEEAREQAQKEIAGRDKNFTTTKRSH